MHAARRSAFAVLPRNALLGAAIGAAAGGVLLLIGAGRAVLVLLGGGRLAPLVASEARLMTAYVGAFALGGALMGAARPFLNSRLAVYAMLALAGAVVMNIIAIGDNGLAAHDTVDWVVMSLVGAIFGLAGARGFLGKG
jgi:hypothetical protein